MNLPTPVSTDEVIVHFLDQALTSLAYAETVMHGGVSAEAWPQVGRILSDIARTMKQVEFTLTGLGG